MRDEILARFPPLYERYVEVFGGAGWVLFHKYPGAFEVFNDRNANLVNLYRCVRDRPEELIAELEFTLNSRFDFDHTKEIMKMPELLPDVKRAALYYQMIRQSYASGLKSYANMPHSMWGNFPLIRAACGRLQRVVIENKDFSDLIALYDREAAFFYCDPPYFATEDYYRDVGFGSSDHERLADALFGIEGMFLLSYNDCEEIRGLYSKPGITIESVSRLDNMAQRYEGGKEYAELLISNYDTSLRENSAMQMSLYDILPFNADSAAEIPPFWAEKERKIIYG